MDVETLAEYLGIAPQTVRNRAGEIPGRRKLGRRVVWDRLELEKWLDGNDGSRNLFSLDGKRKAG